jgi:hypothetical protein
MRNFFKNIFSEVIGERIDGLKEEIPNMVQVEMPECDCTAKHKALLNDQEQLSIEVGNLKRQKSRAEESLAKAELEHKMKVEDIEHMQKMLDEKNSLARDRAVFEAEQNAQTEITKIKNEYTKKLEEDLKGQQGQVKDMVQRVMTALPNVNVELGNRPQAKE